MAYLYQDIMNIPGLAGSAYERQKQLYERLGAPQGGYSGNINQNTWLLNQIRQGNYGNQPAVAPIQQPAQTSLAQQYASSVLPKTINVPTSFEKIVPRSSVVNEDLAQQFAYQQVDPEIQRLKADAMDNFTTGLYSTGGQRFGSANVQRQKLTDQYSRMREEQALPFYQQGINKLSDYYNELSQGYYKDPNAYQYKPIDLNTVLGKKPATFNTTGVSGNRSSEDARTFSY